MDKYCQEKCCLDKCHHDSWDVLRMVPGTYVKSFVKIGSVTAEILLTLSSRWVGGGGGEQSFFRKTQTKVRLG